MSIDLQLLNCRQIEHHLTSTGNDILAAGNITANEVLKVSFVELSEGERSTLLDLPQKVTCSSLPD